MTNFAGGWIAGNAHIINPRTPVKHRETAARQPRNSRNTLCETRETRRETARDSRETAANLMRNRVANSLHLELDLSLRYGLRCMMRAVVTGG